MYCCFSWFLECVHVYISFFRLSKEFSCDRVNAGFRTIDHIIVSFIGVRMRTHFSQNANTNRLPVLITYLHCANRKRWPLFSQLQVRLPPTTLRKQQSEREIETITHFANKQINEKWFSTIVVLFSILRRSELMHTDLTATSLDLSYDGSQSPGSGGSLSQQARNKRMRTSFKHHQLRTMKSYFAINQNPDAKDLKQLSQKTGLSKRVLQVREISMRFNIFRLES